jgi:hypothetical protein
MDTGATGTAGSALIGGRALSNSRNPSATTIHEWLLMEARVLQPFPERH